MKDIDFDELDKAVNSLMATTPAEPGNVADGVKPETTLDVSSQPAPAATVPTAPASPTVETAPVTPPTPVAPAVKRTGRFMDMVHTSSDMKPRTASTTPSREGLSITPRVESSAPASTAPVVATVAPSAATPSPEVKTPDVMPDPIDLGASLETPAAEPDVPAEPITSAPQVSAESPFITDAKVEKRPLNAGAPTLESFDTQLANELGADETAEQSEQTSAETSTDEPPATPQIPELSSDLVAIESNDKIEEPAVAQSTDTKGAATSVGATSIAKQYKSQPSTGDQSHAAIYDASQYPEPVAHPAKKKSGWLWVLWVVLLLAVGAGAAAVLYFLGIIP